MGLEKDIEQFIEHEVQIRVLNNQNTELYKKFDGIDNKIESRFMWMISLVITSIILPVVLHSLELL